MKITIIGLGQMGGNMALTLLKSGFSVCGTDVSPSTRQHLADKGLSVFEPDSPPPADVYLLSLPTSAHVRDVITHSPGLLRHATPGSIIMDCSTSDPDITRELAKKVIAAGLEWLDAPVSGGPKGAAAGKLGMLLGGDPRTIGRVKPLLEALSAKYTHVGGPGCGHVVKLANNYLCAAHLLTTAEALAMATRAGVDPAAFLAGINSGSGRSAVSEVNFPEWILSERYDSGFTTGLMRKDLRLAREAAEKLKMPIGLLHAVVDAWHADPQQPADSADFNCIVQAILRH